MMTDKIGEPEVSYYVKPQIQWIKSHKESMTPHKLFLLFLSFSRVLD